LSLQFLVIFDASVEVLKRRSATSVLRPAIGHVP